MELPKQFHFELRSPDKLWFSGEVNSVRFATEMGQMDIRPAHISLVGNIDFTALEIHADDHIEEYYVRYGTVMIDYGGEAVRILAQDVETRSTMDMKSLSEYLHYLTERLDQKEGLTAYQLKYFGEQRDILQKSIAIISSEKK